MQNEDENQFLERIVKGARQLQGQAEIVEKPVYFLVETPETINKLRQDIPQDEFREFMLKNIEETKAILAAGYTDLQLLKYLAFGGQNEANGHLYAAVASDIAGICAENGIDYKFLQGNEKKVAECWVKSIDYGFDYVTLPITKTDSELDVHDKVGRAIFSSLAIMINAAREADIIPLMEVGSTIIYQKVGRITIGEGKRMRVEVKGPGLSFGYANREFARIELKYLKDNEPHHLLDDTRHVEEVFLHDILGI